ncbi:MAG: hypothetical protein R3B07_09950 [Polyangiaceae bacterium]
MRAFGWMSGAVLLLGSGLVGSACSSRDLDLVMHDLCGFRTNGSAYAEFAVFESECPSNTCGDIEAKLTAGDTSGAVFRKVVPEGSGLPEVGTLSARKYAFGVILKDGSCKPIATGCTCANLEDIKKVEINVAAWANCPAGGQCSEAEACTPLQASTGCIAPSTCVEGRCEGEPGDAGTDSSTDGGGGGCDLTVVASGELPAAVAEDANLSGPAIVATPSGFVIGFREQNPATTALQLVLQGVTDSGSPASPSKIALSACAETPKDPGLGIAFGDGGGVLTASLPDCTGAGAGAVFATFDAGGAATGNNSVSNPAFSELTLARNHSAAPVVGSANDFEFVYRVLTTSGVVVQSATLEGAGFKGGVNTSNLFMAAPAGFAEVTRTDMVRGVLGQIPDRAAVLLQVGATDAMPAELELPDATWGAITSWDDRVLAMVPEATGIHYQLTDASGADLGQGSAGSGSVRGGDVAQLGDRVFFLTGASEKLTVIPYTGANATLDAGTPVVFSGTVGSTALTGFEGDLVSMAAARGQVAVAWITRSKLSAGEPTGGWAVLSCSE